MICNIIKRNKKDILKILKHYHIMSINLYNDIMIIESFKIILIKLFIKITDILQNICCEFMKFSPIIIIKYFMNNRLDEEIVYYASF